jgi:hypothetical protein
LVIATGGIPKGKACSLIFAPRSRALTGPPSRLR